MQGLAARQYHKTAYAGVNQHLIERHVGSQIIAQPMLRMQPGINGLVILPGGKPLRNSSEMLGSAKMAELVKELKSRYPSRIVVFDLPPVLTAADALAFSPYVDAALLVVEEGRTPRDDVVRATEMLASTRLLGTVLNKSSVYDEQEASETPWWRRWFAREGR